MRTFDRSGRPEITLLSRTQFAWVNERTNTNQMAFYVRQSRISPQWRRRRWKGLRHFTQNRRTAVIFQSSRSISRRNNTRMALRVSSIVFVFRQVLRVGCQRLFELRYSYILICRPAVVRGIHNYSNTITFRTVRGDTELRKHVR